MKQQAQAAEIKRLSDKLDALNRKEKDIITKGLDADLSEIEAQKVVLQTEIERLRQEKSKVLSAKAQKLQKLPFNRPVTKAEQADMGALKKTVKGLEVVHPMTALGREMGIKEVTGFARSKF
ncbi:MAG: YibL family ribosome-associated protein [Enterobacteriaceae bacterium]|jgi:ribosome-associated protein|nr:YibL family ribosome-associated protein [Enterobacteriaceae bacterium]